MNFRWVKSGSSDGRAGYRLQFDYDFDKVKRLKETVPAHLREWNADGKYWWVSEYCEKPINDIFPGFLEAVVAQRRLFD